MPASTVAVANGATNNDDRNEDRIDLTIEPIEPDETIDAIALTDLGAVPEWRSREQEIVNSDLIGDGMAQYFFECSKEALEAELGIELETGEDARLEELKKDADRTAQSALRTATRVVSYFNHHDPAQTKTGWFAARQTQIADFHRLTQQVISLGFDAIDDFGAVTGFYPIVYRFWGRVNYVTDKKTGEETNEIESRKPNDYWRPAPIVLLDVRVTSELKKLREDAETEGQTLAPSALRLAGLDIVFKAIESESKQPHQVKLSQMLKRKSRKKKTMEERLFMDADRVNRKLGALLATAEDGTKRQANLKIAYEQYKKVVVSMKAALRPPR